jgi:hypothetical protein
LPNGQRKPRAARKPTADIATTHRTAPVIGGASLRLDPNQVAKRAFIIFLERGAKHDHDLDDWLQAERELIAARRT